MNCKFSLYLKASRQRRERFHKTAGERTIAGQHVADAIAKNMGNNRCRQPITQAMAAPIRPTIGWRAHSRHHVQLFIAKLLEHGRCHGGVVRAVAIHQDVNIRLQVREHATDNVALSLQPLLADDCAGLAGLGHRKIAGVIVIYVHRNVSERGAKIGDDPRDCRFFVIAGDQHGHFRV